MNLIIKYTLILFLISMPAFSTRYAILVGNSSGNGNLSNLKYVKNDLSAVKNILISNCNFKDINIETLFNKSPQNIKQSINTILSKIEKKNNDLFLFYYSGHADHNNLIMGNKLLSLQNLKSLFNTIPSNMKIFVFDACQSGSFARLKGGTISTPFLIPDENNIEGQVVLYSSSSTEFSQESDYYKQSIFSFHLVNALKGCADLSGDKQISLNEAYEYAYNQTISSTINSAGGIQHPGYLLNIQGKGNVILADMRSKHNGIILDKSIKGSIAVLDARNNIITDIIKKDSNEIFLALNPGKFNIYNNANTETKKTKVHLSGSTIQHLKGTQFKKVKSIPIYTKGGMSNKTTIGIVTQFGFTKTDYSTLSTSIESDYASFNQFHISTKVPFNNEQWQLGTGLELSFPNGLMLYSNYLYNKLSNDISNSGYTITPKDSTQYPVKLKIQNNLNIHELNLGIGYSFKKPALRFLSVGSGIDIMLPILKSESNFSDELYKTYSNVENVNKGILILPSLKIIFDYPFSRIFKLGTTLKYRFQINPNNLLSNKYSYDYNFRGLSAAIRLKFTINGN